MDGRMGPKDREMWRHRQTETRIGRPSQRVGLEMQKLRTGKKKCYEGFHFLVEAQGDERGRRPPLLITLSSPALSKNRKPFLAWRKG